MAKTSKRLELAAAKAAYEVAMVTLHNVFAMYASAHYNRGAADQWLQALEDDYGQRDSAYLETERQRLEVKLQVLRVEVATRRLHAARNAVKLESQSTCAQHSKD